MCGNENVTVVWYAVSPAARWSNNQFVDPLIYAPLILYIFAVIFD